MKVLLVGGGTGGHITPLLAVARELKALSPDARLSYIGERGGKFTGLAHGHDLITDAHHIFAGKFRRYHGESWLRRLLDIRTNLKNLRDALFAFIGFWQALVLLLRLRPDVIFIKGGFVGVPVGLAAALCRVPYVTHDSDTIPGLANRIIARWARMHATGMPAELYPYPPAKTRYTGIPVAAEFMSVTETNQQDARRKLDLPASALVLLVTGGSQGSQRVNEAVRRIVPALLEGQANLYVIHHVGHGNAGLYTGFAHERLIHQEFFDRFYEAMLAADLVVARAGATTIAELAIQKKPAILIPSPFLAGGHQLKNAAHLAERGAVCVIDEAAMLNDPQLLENTIKEFLEDAAARDSLAAKLAELAKPDAARELAETLIEIAA